MGLSNDVVAAVATKALTVAGVRGTSSRPPDSIPVTPWCVIQPPTATFSPGALERIDYRFPVLLIVERVPDGGRVTATAYDLVDAFVTTFRSGIALGLTASGVWQAIIESWDSDLFLDIAGSTYHCVSLVLLVQVGRETGYTA
jgi:hypothetical protein